MYAIKIAAGDDTNELAQFITDNLTDEVLDQVTVEREIIKESKLPSEPISISVVLITTSATAIAAVASLISQWMKTQQHSRHLDMLASMSLKDKEAAGALVDLAKSYNHASLAFVQLKTGGKAED